MDYSVVNFQRGPLYTLPLDGASKDAWAYALNVGLEIWDQDDHLVFCNGRVNHMAAGFLTPEGVGVSFHDLMRANLDLHRITAAIGREDDWLAQRMASRCSLLEPPSHPELHALPNDRWLNAYKTRTPDGFLVVVWADVSDLVRNIHTLELNNQRLALQSSTDGLTGLANRGRFDEVLPLEWQRAARSGTPLSLLMVDIDHFKRFNDWYGHPAGDGCLRQVAATLLQCVRRAGELVARYGGEEFVMLLPGADLAQACDTAQKCLDQMESESLAHAASPTADHVTLSIGLSCLIPDGATDPRAMVNAADAAMYRAKSNGRSRLEIANQADWDIESDTPRTRPAPL